MSNKTRLEAVSSALDTAINTANSLPDAGGGGDVKTCTVTINCYDYPSNSFTTLYWAYISQNGQFVPIQTENITETQQFQARRGTIFMIAISRSGMNDYYSVTIDGSAFDDYGMMLVSEVAGFVCMLIPDSAQSIAIDMYSG